MIRNIKKLTIGTQVAYIPDHAEGKIGHEAVEFGFIYRHAPDDDAAYCKYWRQDLKGLRTVAGSELTQARHLITHTCVPVGQVQEALDQLALMEALSQLYDVQFIDNTHEQGKRAREEVTEILTDLQQTLVIQRLDTMDWITQTLSKREPTFLVKEK